jgi:hypothetical protein
MVGTEMKKRLKSLNGNTVWMSTSGLGVHWVHMRMDSNPKYYSHKPYKHSQENSKIVFCKSSKSSYQKFQAGNYQTHNSAPTCQVGIDQYQDSIETYQAANYMAHNSDQTNKAETCQSGNHQAQTCQHGNHQVQTHQTQTCKDKNSHSKNDCVQVLQTGNDQAKISAKNKPAENFQIENFFANFLGKLSDSLTKRTAENLPQGPSTKKSSQKDLGHNHSFF